MRGDATLTARLLLRPAGIAGLTAAAGGILAVVGAVRPWYVAIARVEMLGSDQSRSLPASAGVPDGLGAWVALLLGLAVAVVGLAVALDRPLPRSRGVLVGAALALLLIAGVGAATPPDAARVLGDDVGGLLALAQGMPVGVELALATRVGDGIWLVAAAGGLVGAGAAAAREV